MPKRVVYTCLLIIITLNSCTHFYAPALMNSDIAYQPKPISQDSIKTINYITGSYSYGSGAELTDRISFLQANVSRATVYKNFNMALGVYGFTGNYLSRPHLVADKDLQSFNKGFSGIGGRTSINYFIAKKRTNFRIIGLEASYSKEFGDYAQFRKQSVNHPDFSINSETNIFTAGLTSEIISHTKNSIHTQHGIRIFIGDTFTNEGYSPKNPAPGYPARRDDTYVSLNYFLQINKLHFNIECTPLSSRLGLGYRF